MELGVAWGDVARTLHDRLRSYLQRRRSLHAGDSVGVAVSGGADSVALLRLLLDLRAELGLVLSVVHFNHRIRGAEALADERFAAALAARFDLPFHLGSGDVPAYREQAGLSLETAARELRYRYFRQLLAAETVAKIATGHTLDDQAETVLLRLLRGSGTRGLAAIYPEIKVVPGTLVRPLLPFQHSELVQYLRSAGQDWREDATNLDPTHTRNRIRHVLLPLLEAEFNPAIRQVLADTAEIARAEEAWWQQQVEAHAIVHTDPEAGTARLAPCQLEPLPLALRRRTIHALAQSVGLRLDFQQVERVLDMCGSPVGTHLELPHGWRAEIEREPVAAGAGVRGAVLSLRQSTIPAPADPAYEYPVPIPGEISLPELEMVLRSAVIHLTAVREAESPPSGDLLDLSAVLPQAGDCGSGLRVRNWCPGDRFWPLHAKGPKKVKQVLQAARITGRERKGWPVMVAANGEVVWMHRFGVGRNYAPQPHSREAILIECRPVET